MKVRDISELARQCGAIVGDAHVRAPIGHESRAATLIVEPGNADEVRELVGKGEADAITLAPLGAGRTLAQMRSAPVDIGISLARMNRVIAYEPDDMTIIAEAGLTLAALNALTGRAGNTCRSIRRTPTGLRWAHWWGRRTPVRCACRKARCAIC